MTTVTLNPPIADARPLLRARLAATFYLLAIAAAAVTLVIDSNAVVRGNAAATAARLLTIEPLFQLSFVASVVATVSCAAAAVLSYGLFKPVDERLSFVAAFLSAEASLIGATVSVLHLAALVVAKGSHALSVADAHPLRALILRLLELNADASALAVLFFAGYSFVAAYLVSRSTLLPRVAGALTLTAGLLAIVAAAAPYMYAPMAGLLSACVRCLAEFC